MTLLANLLTVGKSRRNSHGAGKRRMNCWGEV